MQAQIYPGRQDLPDWNNPRLMQINRLQPHAYRIPFPDLAGCRHAVSENRRFLSPYIINLSGTWDYRFYPSVLQLPENILSFRSGFEPRTVPDKFGGLGFRLYPEQQNNLDCRYPFPAMPPWIPQEQPVLVYHRTCSLPALWSGLRKHLVLHGIRSAFHVFINGRPAGYSSGSGLPAEFDLTQSLHDGDNELFILVYPLSVGSYLEQSSCRLSPGIIHDLYLEAVPAISLYDYQVRTVWLAEKSCWRLDLELTVTSGRISLDQPQVTASLRLDDQVVKEESWSVTLSPADPTVFLPPIQTIGTLAVSMEMPDILSWCDEQPNLYDLFLTVEDRSGRDLASVHQAVGFRTLCWNHGLITVNGRPVQLRAVSWTEQYEPEWSADSLGPVIRLLTLFKKQQFNTLYFRDLPPDPILLELCSIFGFYVVEDAPLDIRDPDVMNTLMLREPALLHTMAADRLSRLILRDRNQPCILAWSAGLLARTQKSPCQEWLDSLAGEMRRLDPTRPLHGYDFPDLAADLDQWLSGSRRTQPADLSWIVCSGKEAAGHCFYDLSQSVSFLSGLGALFQPVEFRMLDAAAGRFLLRNTMTWTDLSQFRICWQLLSHGIPIQVGELDQTAVAPGHEWPFTLQYDGLDEMDAPDSAAGGDYLVRFDVRRNMPSLTDVAGEVICSQEFHLYEETGADGLAPMRTGGGRIRLESDRHHLIVSGPRFWLVFSRLSGMLESWRSGEKELIASAPSLAAGLPGFQPATGSGLHCSLKRRPETLDKSDLPYWHEQGFDRLWTQILSTHEGCDGQMAVIEFSGKLGAAGLKPACGLQMRYEIMKTGELRVFASLSKLDDQVLAIPGFSLALSLRRNYDHVSWQGTGPGRSQARLPGQSGYGIHEQDIVGMISQPLQEGLWKDIRWLTFKDDSGFGLRIHSGSPFCFDLVPSESPSHASWQGLAGDGLPPVVQIFHPAAYQTCLLDEPMKMSLIMQPIVSADRNP